MSFSFNVSGTDKADALAQFGEMLELAATENSLSSEIVEALQSNAVSQIALLPDSDPRRVRVSIDAVQDGAEWTAFQVSAGLVDG